MSQLFGPFKRLLRPLPLVLLMTVLVVTACAGASDDSEPPQATEAQPDEGGDGGEDGDDGTDSESPSGSPGDGEAALEDLIAAAEDEGEFYMASPIAEAQQQALAQAFEEKYDIQVTYAQISHGELEERLRIECDTGNLQMDWVVDISRPEMEDIMTAGCSVTPDPEEIPNLQAVLDENPELHYGDYTWVGGSAFTLGWNTDLVDEAPSSFCDLADEAYSDGGLLLVDNPATATSYFAYQGMKEACGDDFLSRIADLSPQYTESIASTAPSIAAGEALAGLVGAHVAQPLIDDGAPLAWLPVDGMSVSTRYAMILDAGLNPNAAKLWHNFFLSPEAQSLMYGNQQGVPAAPSLVSDAVALPDQWQLADGTLREEGVNVFIDSIRRELGLS